MSIRANTNKENIPSSSDSSSGSVRENTGCSVDAQGGQSGVSEQTPKPRKSKQSPTLVQLTDNQDAHTVSHDAFSFYLCDLSSTLLWYCGFLMAAFFSCSFSLTATGKSHSKTASTMQVSLTYLEQHLDYFKLWLILKLLQILQTFSQQFLRMSLETVSTHSQIFFLMYL